MKLSIIIPVYNEEKTIVQAVKRVLAVSLPAIKKEIIIVDDGSTDSSTLQVQNAKLKNIKLLSHAENQGKGAAVRTGIQHATGEYVLIQDADLEYDPRDIERLLEPVREGKAKVVYGSRLQRLPNFSRDERTPRFLLHYIGNKCLSLLTSILYGAWITDMESGYKLFPKQAVGNMILHAKGFEFEPEITAKLLKKGYHIHEVAIRTNPRGQGEGKKLRTLPDGWKALVTLLLYRFRD